MSAAADRRLPELIPEQSSRRTPVMSRPCSARVSTTAAVPWAKPAGRSGSRSSATSRQMVSARTLSEYTSIERTRSVSGADDTRPSSPPVSTAVSETLTRSGSTPSSRARARPAASAGSVERGEYSSAGSRRPASSIHASTGATLPAAISAGTQFGPIRGPVYGPGATTIRAGVIPAARTTSAAWTTVAAPGNNGPGFAPPDMVGSPPGTTTRVSGSAPRARVVSTLASGGSWSMAATAVSSLVVDAGTLASRGRTSHSTCPVASSTTLAVRSPTAGSWASGVRIRLSAAGSGIGAEPSAGSRPGFTS